MGPAGVERRLCGRYWSPLHRHPVGAFLDGKIYEGLGLHDPGNDSDLVAQEAPSSSVDWALIQMKMSHAPVVMET